MIDTSSCLGQSFLASSQPRELRTSLPFPAAVEFCNAAGSSDRTSVVLASSLCRLRVFGIFVELQFPCSRGSNIKLPDSWHVEQKSFSLLQRRLL